MKKNLDLWVNMHPYIKKLIMELKIAILIFVAGVSSVFANSGYSQVAKVSLEMNNSKLEKVLDEIESQSEFYFIFNQKQIDVNRVVDIRAEDQLITDILPQLFKGTDVNFTILDRKILLTTDPVEDNLLVSKAEADLQQKGITGKVTDSKGDALTGVNVILKGTTIGAITDIDGKYIINVPGGNGVLIFSFIGYTSKELTLDGSSTYDIALSEESLTLNEVVVTALGIKREKKALTYSVSEIGGEAFSKAIEINLGNALSGRVAGVTASGTTGGPAASSRVIIRGNGSLNGDNQPLYVVNGMPITNSNPGSAGTYGGIDRGDGLSSINPDDIASISVLKGGTAAALYGSRAANGVILITTKSGRAQKGIGIQYNTSYTYDQVINLLDWQYEYGSGGGGIAPTTQTGAIAFGRTSWGAKLDGSQVIQPDGELRPYSAQKNNVKNFYQSGSTFTNSIAFEGGNETANFHFSTSNTDNKAIVPNNTMNRKTFNLGVNATLAKKLIFEGNAQYSTEEVKNRTYLADFQLNPNAGAQLIATNIDVRTLSPGFGEDGYETLWSDYIYATNPYFAINKIKNGDNTKRFIGSFKSRYNITDFLYASVRVGLDQVDMDGYAITPTGTAFNNRGQMSTDNSLRSESNIEGTLGFNKDFGQFSVNILTGGNQMKNQYSGINLGSGQFNLPFQYFIGNGSSQTFSKAYSELGINSLFASADIDFNNYIYMSLSGRNDWFSTLDASNNNLFYPSVGLSFVASEAWKSKPNWMDYAKIRTSWAQVGGGAPNPYSIYQTYIADAVTHLGQTLMSVSSATIPSLLTPYTSTTLEAGLEMRVLKDRLSFDLTVYDRTTTDDIVNAAIPESSGYTSVALNVGKMRNRGVEVMLSGTPVKSGNGLSWDLSLNVAYNDNKVIKISDGLTSLMLPGATTRTLNGWIYHFEGQPFGMVAGYKQLTNADGQLVFNKTSGLPVAGPLQALGKGVAPLAIALNNNVRFKNFNLSFLLDSRWGGSIYSATNAYGTDFGVNKMTTDNNIRETGIEVSGVDQNGDPYSATISAEKYYRGIAYSITDQFVESADFIKVRSFTFGYNLPASILSKTPVKSANISFVGRNLLILYNAAKNIDPESNYNNSNAQGLENFGLPTTRSYGFNLSLSF
jgi:TonB-linked SusC/RagA family outer membrane protein